MKNKNYAAVIGSVLAIGLSALVIYRFILFPGQGGSLYPWGSDTLGHLLKVEYLAQNLAAGDLYPNIMPDWYMGLQVMRYHPPLPYYVLVGLLYLIPDPVMAASWLITLCALAGGLTWLLYKRWLGLLPAVFGGVLFLFLPDNVRVALAEGNLPRVLATALLPLAVYFLLRSLEESGNFWHRLGLVLCFALIVLSHAMMAAIYAVCCGILASVILLKRATSFRRAALSMISIGLGLMLSGWWLLPSFSGGITELDTSAMTEALAAYPLINYLNPGLRARNPEAVYFGSALLILSVAALWLRDRRNSQTISLTLIGTFGVLITTPGFNDVFNSLPLHNLLWPQRFLGIASFALLLALMWSLRGWGRISPILAFGVVAVLAIDGAGSLHLIKLRPLNPDIAQISQKLDYMPGWREATLDLSQLGSGTSYSFSTQDRREQIFGWAYQGASTAQTVAGLNEALEMGYLAYLRDRLNLYGTDDVVLLKEIPGIERISDDLLEGGYRKEFSGLRADLYHRNGAPRAVVASWDALGIGTGARNLAYLFPRLIVGTSNHVDDYDFKQLRNYQTLVLSGFEWRDKGNAERLIELVADSGVQVLVDLTGVEEDPFARAPRFLGVWGEQAILPYDTLLVSGEGRQYSIDNFGEASGSWHTHMLQGLDEEVWSFDYLGEKAVLAGYNTYGSGEVWFVGLNLPYFAVKSGQPVAVQLLADLLELPPHDLADYSKVSLSHYLSNPNGYQFSYQLDFPQALFVPIAFLDGMKVYVDGDQVEVYSFEQLLAFDAPPGEHSVEVRMSPTRIYTIGQIVTGFAILALFGLVVYERRTKE